MRAPAAVRFAAMARRDESGCLRWIGVHIWNGYGRFTVASSRKVLAHRFAWEQANGPIPDGLFVLHRWDMRDCVEPSHLFLGTVQDNTDDMMSKGRYVNGRAGVTQCKHGHAYTPENTLSEPSRKGWRACRTCVNQRARARYHRRRQAEVAP